MCRFLIIHSLKEFSPENYTEDFIEKTKKSLTPDGDLQKDGWGIFYLNYKNNTYNIFKSLNPIWEDKINYNDLGKINFLALHVRSSSTPYIENKIEYNQPYYKENFLFLFNGLLKGVKIQSEGEIGAQKLFNLFFKFYKDEKEDFKIFKEFISYVKENSKEIVGLNLAIVNIKERKIFINSKFSCYEDYFTLKIFKNKNFLIISSVTLDNIEFEKIKNDSILEIDF
jgi:predicted glutamine amidotransferase